MQSDTFGMVYLVGAGPGDPGLLTLRAKECLERAEVVIYDALVNPVMLDHARGAELIYAGKKSDRHSLPQEDIAQVLIDQARRHRHVVRLKGGDPFIFGRGGEEALALRGAGVPFEVVPGVTAATGCAAYAGIPLTHRGISSSVTFLTGHTGADESASLVDLPNLALQGSLVFYMGVKNCSKIVASLMEMGRPPATPAAVIEWGTYARQRTVSAPLSEIVAAVEAAEIGAPAVLIVGEVAALRDDLSWFEARPLFGLRVVVTHAAQAQGVLESRLRELGASVFSFPTIEIAPAAAAPLLEEFRNFDWIVLTSANAAEMVFEHLEEQELDARALAGVRLCAVGATTVEAVQRRFLRVDAVPMGHAPEAVLQAMAEFEAVSGQKVLLPRSDIARSALPHALREAGAVVTELMAYEKRAPSPDSEFISAMLDFAPELLVFTNAGAARNFARIVGEEALTTLRNTAVCASIGPVTTVAIEEQRMQVAIEPARHELPHLLESICKWRT